MKMVVAREVIGRMSPDESPIWCPRLLGLNSFAHLVDRALALELPTRSNALGVLDIADAETPALIAAVAGVRRYYFGDPVKLNFLFNAKSGLCPEDCHYCSQSKLSTAPLQRYRLLGPDQGVEAASTAVATGAKRFCMVASGRGFPTLWNMVASRGSSKGHHFGILIGPIAEQPPPRQAAGGRPIASAPGERSLRAGEPGSLSAPRPPASGTEGRARAGLCPKGRRGDGVTHRPG